MLDELERNLAKIPAMGTPGARRQIDAMIRAFPYATVQGYPWLLGDMPGLPGDAHVMAVAVVSTCQVIVTENLKDSPADGLVPWGVSVLGPDDFLLDQPDLYPRETLRAVCAHAIRRHGLR